MLDLFRPGQNEILHYFRGLIYIDNILNLDFTFDHWLLDLVHPPFGPYIMGILEYPKYSKWMPKGKQYYMTEAHIPFILSDESRYMVPRAGFAVVGATAAAVNYFFARKFVGRGWSFTCGILTGVNLFWVYYTVCCQVLDPPMTLFALIGMIFLYNARERNSIRWLILSGFMFGLSISSKYIGLFFLLAAAIWLLFEQDTSARAKKILVLAVSAFTMFLLTYPWIWFNNPVECFLAILQANQEYQHTQFNPTLDHLFNIFKLYPVDVYGLDRAQKLWFTAGFVLSPVEQFFLLVTILSFLQRRLHHEKFSSIERLLVVYIAIPLFCLSLTADTRATSFRPDFYLLGILPPLIIAVTLGLRTIHSHLKYSEILQRYQITSLKKNKGLN